MYIRRPLLVRGHQAVGTTPSGDPPSPPVESHFSRPDVRFPFVYVRFPIVYDRSAQPGFGTPGP